MIDQPYSDPALTRLEQLGDGYTPLLVWFELISGARFWPANYAGMANTARHGQMLEMLDRYRQVAARLQKFPAMRWQQMATGAGWNAVGCTALSWCQEASLALVLDIWRRLGHVPAGKPAADFASLLLNPSLLPDNSLSSIVVAGKDGAGVALLLAARVEAPVIDLSADEVSRLPGAVQEMIGMRSPSTTSAT